MMSWLLTILCNEVLNSSKQQTWFRSWEIWNKISVPCSLVANNNDGYMYNSLFPFAGKQPWVPYLYRSVLISSYILQIKPSHFILFLLPLLPLCNFWVGVGNLETFRLWNGFLISKCKNKVMYGSWIENAMNVRIFRQITDSKCQVSICLNKAKSWQEPKPPKFNLLQSKKVFLELQERAFSSDNISTVTIAYCIVWNLKTKLHILLSV